MAKREFLALHGINPETKLKMKLLSFALGKPMVRLAEEMIEKMWLQYEDTLISTVPQNKVNREARKILGKMNA